MNTVFRVARQIYNYNMDITAVAAALGIARSTLKRKLREKGTCFNEIKAAVRVRMVEKLARQNKTLECVVIELGFETERSTDKFIRAHKGVSYGRYLKHIEDSALQDMVFIQVQG